MGADLLGLRSYQSGAVRSRELVLFKYWHGDHRLVFPRWSRIDCYAQSFLSKLVTGSRPVKAAESCLAIPRADILTMTTITQQSWILTLAV